MGYMPWCWVSRLGRALVNAVPRLSRSKEPDMLWELVWAVLSCIWLVPIKTKTRLASVLVLLESSNSSEGLVLSTGNIVSESAKPLALGLAVSQGVCLCL